MQPNNPIPRYFLTPSEMNLNVCIIPYTWVLTATLFIITKTHPDVCQQVNIYTNCTTYIQWNSWQQTGTNYWFMYNTGKTLIHFAKWKKPGPKGYIKYVSIYLTPGKNKTTRGQKIDLWLPAFGIRGRGWLQSVNSREFCGQWNYSIWYCGGGYMTLFVKTKRTTHHKELYYIQIQKNQLGIQTNPRWNADTHKLI